MTVGLMIVSLLIFIPSYYTDLSYRHKMEDILKKIQSIDPFYFVDKEKLKKDPSMSQVMEMIKKRESGNEERAELLKKLKAQLDELKENRPFVKWGFKPAKWSLITAITFIFLHNGWIHLIVNMFFLWMVGCNIEDRWGPWFFAVFYIVGGMVSAGAHALFHPGSEAPLIGASGAVAAVMGAFLVRYYKTRIRFFYIIWIFLYFIKGTFRAPAYVILPLWFLREVFFGTTDVATGIAHWAHVGGFAFGAAAGLTLWATGIEKKYFEPRYSLEGEEHEVPEEYQRAHELLARGDREGAKKKLILAATRRGGYLPASVTLSKIYAEERNRRELIKVTEQIVKQTLARNEPQIAIEAFQRMLKAFPDASLNPVLQFRMAAVLAEGDLFQEACWAYRNLAGAYPNEILAQKSLMACAGILAGKLGMHKNALDMYNHLLKYYPDSALAERAREGLEKARRAIDRPSGK